MNVVVFLSARSVGGEVKKLTRSVGRMLAFNKHKTLYGGGYSGMMGVLANAVEKVGGKIFGVTTHRLVETEGKGYDPNTTALVKTMGQRKDYLLDEADCAVILPGGFGTMDEFFETLTYKQLGLFDGDIFILDSEIQPALEKLAMVMLKRGTIDKKDYDKLNFVSTVEELKERLDECKGN